MNFDQLKAEWAQRDERLDTALHINNQLLRSSLLDRHQHEIEKLAVWDKYEFFIGIPLFIFLVWFIGEHYTEWKFLLPAYTLLAWSIVMTVLNFTQRHALHNMDYALPVLDLQRELAAQKSKRLFLFKWAFLTGQLLWNIPFLIVIFEGLFGVDLYKFLNNYILFSLVSGTLFIPFALFMSKILSPRLKKSSRFHGLTDILAGKELVLTRNYLQKLDRFENQSKQESM